MKNLKVKSLFVGMFVAAAMALTACGGGSSDSGSEINPGDGVVTQTEADTLKADMTQQQVAEILGNPVQNFYPQLVYPGEAINGRATKWSVSYDNNTGLARAISHHYSDGNSAAISVKLL